MKSLRIKPIILSLMLLGLLIVGPGWTFTFGIRQWYSTGYGASSTYGTIDNWLHAVTYAYYNGDFAGIVASSWSNLGVKENIPDVAGLRYYGTFAETGWYWDANDGTWFGRSELLAWPNGCGGCSRQAYAVVYATYNP